MATRAFDGPEQETDLRVEMARLTERLTRAEQALAQRRPARRPRRGGRWLAAALLALLLALMPLALLAATPFDDLNPGSAHNGDIDLIYKAGITRGCIADRRYCPNASVTNEQLASFLARTAGLGNYAPVVNARTAVHAANAATAGTLQGYVPADFLLATEDVNLRYSFLSIASDDNATFAHSPGPTTTVIPDDVGLVDFLLPLDAPVEMFGQALRVHSFEVCYEMEGGLVGGLFINTTELYQGRSGQADLVVQDTTDRGYVDPSCYTVTLDAPAAITGALYLRLEMWLTHASNRPNLYSVRLILRPFS